MSTNPYQAGSVDYYKYQTEQSKKKQADALQAQANETIASQSFQDAQANLQQKALQTGHQQTLDTAALNAQKEKTLDKYVSQILPGYGAIGPSGGSVTSPQKVYSIPVQDQQAKDNALRSNYQSFQNQNLQLQQQALGRQANPISVGFGSDVQRTRLDRSQLTDAQMSFVRQQEASGALRYADQVQVNDKTGDISLMFNDVNAAKQNYNDFFAVQRQNTAIRQANEKAKNDFNDWVSSMQGKGFGDLQEAKNPDGSINAKFTSITANGKKYPVNADGTYNIPDPLLGKEYKPDAAETAWSPVMYLGQGAAGLVGLGGGLAGKAADLLGLKGAGDSIRKGADTASQSIQQATNLNAFSSLTENLGRTFQNDKLYAESIKAQNDQQIIDVNSVQQGSAIGLATAVAIGGLQKVGAKSAIEQTTGINLGNPDKAYNAQIQSLTQRPAEFAVNTGVDVATLFASGFKTPKISKGSPLQVGKDFTEEAQVAAKRAGVEDAVKTYPVEQKTLSSGEIVNVPLQPTRFSNIAISNSSAKIPIIGGKRLDVGIMQNQDPIFSVRVPENINYKKIVTNPAREVVTQDNSVIGMISPKVNKTIIQNPTALPTEIKSNLVGQDISATKNTADWIKSQQGLDAIKKQGVSPYYHSPKIQEMIEGYAVKNDPLLNTKGKKLQKALGDAYTQADNLQAKKSAIEAQLSDVQSQIDSIQTSSATAGTGTMSASSSIDLGALSDLTNTKADLTQQLGDVQVNLLGVQQKIDSAYAKYGTTHGDALAALQRASETFYKRGSQPKSYLNGSPADVPYPAAKNIPARTGDLRAQSTTDIFNLEKNPSLPSSQFAKLAGYDLAKNGEGLTPDGNFFLKKNGSATKLRWNQVATDVEFNLTDVTKSAKQASKAQKTADNSLRSTKPSTPFSISVESGKPAPVEVMPKSEGPAIIEIPTLQPKESASFQSVKRSIFDAEQSTKSNKSLGLGGNASGYINIGALGLGGATGAERASRRKSKTQISETSEFLRYPGEKLTPNAKQNTRTETSLSLGSLLEGGNPFNTRPQKNTAGHVNSLFTDIMPKSGQGGRSRSDVKISHFTGQTTRQGTSSDHQFRLDIPSPRPTPPTPRPTKLPPSLISPQAPPMSFGMHLGQTPKGSSSSKKRAVQDVFFGGALGLEGTNTSLIKTNSKVAKSFGKNLTNAANIFGKPAKKSKKGGWF